MPIGFSSPARNLFLLGSSGAQVVTNFFKTIDQSAGTDGFYLPSEIKYNFVDQKFLLAGSAEDSNSKGFGWFEKRDETGTADFENRIEATTSVNTTLLAMELDVNDKLIVGGKTGDVPWIAKYSNGGVIEWQSTTNTANLEYIDITSDSNGQYYACGSQYPGSGAVAFVEKFDANGNPGWGKSAFMLGREVLLNAIAANSRGEVVAVGQIEDDNSYKGYIVKIDTNTGEVLWDRTLTQHLTAYGYVVCQDVYIDSNDQIYIVGAREGGNPPEPTEGFLIKYSPEGNIIWQKASYTPDGTLSNYAVKSDGETEQTIVFGTYYDQINNDLGGVLTKYSKDGSLVWRRTLFSSYNNSDVFGSLALDADPSFYYLLYVDDNYNGLTGTPEAYTYGKVSSSGNGLGNFQYEEGTGETIDYEILNVQDKIGRLSDGSVRNDTSDLLTYPFNGTKVLFDDLATQVSNKKRQMDSAGSFEYSGSPAVRPADFMELDLGDESFDVTVPAAEAVYEEAGTYTFTVPAGVTEVSAVVVGSGGGAASSPGANAQAGGGGGGGGLAYGTFTVTPGEDLTIVVGNFGVGGASGTTAGTAGESTTISRGATVLLEGGGGAGGQADAPAQGQNGSTASGGTSSGTERDGGGSGGTGGTARYNWGGGGGGGAGGYTGNGGNAGNGNNTTGDGLGLPGSGGGGGGGGGQNNTGTQNNGGGGVGLFGGPINGAGGANSNPGGGGSNGQGGQPGGKGGKFGGGGGGGEDDTNTPGGDGGIGGARIIWGAGRSFPNNAAQDFSSVETRVRDKSGKGNDGVVNGATLNTAGYWEFDGVDDYIKVGIDPTDDYSNFTVEVWFNPSSVSNYENVLDCNFNTSWVSGNVGPRLEMYETGRLTWLFSDDITNNQVNSQFDVVSGNPGDEISNGNWYHCAITFDGSGGAAYLNGEQTRTTPSSTNGSATGGEFHGFFTDVRLGNGFHLSGNTERLFTGNIGEVRFYPRALTAAQVFQNYNATKSKYLNEAPDTAPKISDKPIVYDNNLLLNYDFGNRATYDTYTVPLLPNTISSTEQKFTASDAAASDYFGGAVAVGSNRIVVGADLDDDNGSASGSAYIYNLDGSNEVKITASDGAANDLFGTSVAVGNERVVVGALFDNSNQGSAYIYDLDGSNEVKITASDGAAGDQFGESVAVGNGKIVVGASTKTIGSNAEQGAAYIYDLDGSNEVKITASDGTEYEYFGYSVAVGNNKIVVGSLFAEAVYIYDLDGSNEVKITASDVNNNRFGYSVAVGSGKIVVGADGDDTNRGAAYIYDLDGSNEVKIIASDGVFNDSFGFSVAVGNERIVVGAYGDDDNGSSSGSAYIFDLDGNQLAKITASDAAAGDYFGYSVAVGSGYAVIGAESNDDNGSQSGSAYRYSLTTPLPTTVKNLSSSSYTNTINGATFNSAGYFDFDGTNDNIFNGTPETIVYSGGTFEAWLYFDDVSNNRGFMSHSAGGAGPYINFYMPGASQSKMRWEVIANTGSAYTTILSNTNLTTGQWYHFVGTFDGASTISLYVNGTLDISNPNMSNQPTTVTAAIELAEYAGYMDGRIGESRIYNRELSATEVLQNYNATRAKYGV